MHDVDTATNLALVERYFEKVTSGATDIGDLFADDIVWLAPASSPVGRRHEGKAAVLALMGTGIDLYDPDTPLQIEIDTLAADGAHVFAEMTLSAKTRAGESYRNHYVFVFRLHAGRIVEIHEHLDTHYAQRLLFDPAGQSSGLDA